MRADYVVYLDLQIFCHDVMSAVAAWLKVVKWQCASVRAFL